MLRKKGSIFHPDSSHGYTTSYTVTGEDVKCLGTNAWERVEQKEGWECAPQQWLKKAKIQVTVLQDYLQGNCFLVAEKRTWDIFTVWWNSKLRISAGCPWWMGEVYKWNTLAVTIWVGFWQRHSATHRAWGSRVPWSRLLCVGASYETQLGIVNRCSWYYCQTIDRPGLGRAERRSPAMSWPSSAWTHAKREFPAWGGDTLAFPRWPVASGGPAAPPAGWRPALPPGAAPCGSPESPCPSLGLGWLRTETGCP